MGYAAEFVRATVVKLQQPFFDHAVLLTYNMHSSTLLIFLDLHSKAIATDACTAEERA
jgi:hypothetical protein